MQIFGKSMDAHGGGGQVNPHFFGRVWVGGPENPWI